MRFSNDPKLGDVAKGKATVKDGDSGVHVTKIAQALADLGYLAAAKVGASFTADVKAALANFQKDHGGAGAGAVDQPTMAALDKAFTGYGAEAKAMRGVTSPTKPTEGVPFDVAKTPKELLDGTRGLTDDDRTATGKLPDFHDDVGGEKYADAVRERINKVVDYYLTNAKKMDTERKAGHLYERSSPPIRRSPTTGRIGASARS